jgi:hypothetical protein
MTNEEERRAEEECCGAVIPDEMCGQCPDCLEEADNWREIYGEER